MYQEADQWPEALKLAQLHLPHQVAEVNMAYQSAQARAGRGASKSDYMTTGRNLEQSKQWSQAVDAYMSARRENCSSDDGLEEIWDRAIEVARNYVPNRLVQVALDVSGRLVQLQREESAADVLFEIGRHDEAISVCIAGKRFDKARALAQGNPSLKRRVDEAYQGHLVSSEGTTELVELGRTDVALDVLAKRGEWDRIWDVAAKERMSVGAVGKYVLMRVEELLGGGKEGGGVGGIRSTQSHTSQPTHQQIDEAVKLLNKRPGPSTDVAMSAYKRLVKVVLCRSSDEDSSSEHITTVAMLRDVLYRLANQYRGQSPDKQQLSPSMEAMLMATHYQNMLYISRSLGLKEICAKCAITLLKYPEFIPVDKAFYQAGMMAKEQGNINLAFMLLNRYVDLTEAIDSGGETNMLDNTEYHDTDAIPLVGGPNGAQLPSTHYIRDEDKREEVRTWVLSVVTDSNIEQRFTAREHSRGTLYEALYMSERPTCIVTGYPVHPADLLEINHSTANRREWNALVAKTRLDPWTSSQQMPLY